jgi:hypothetical protein
LVLREKYAKILSQASEKSALQYGDLDPSEIALKSTGKAGDWKNLKDFEIETSSSFPAWPEWNRGS